MKVFIIEDDVTQMKLVNVVLANAGHVVSGATEAADAMKAIKKNRPNVILMDLGLPGVDGLALARMLKQDTATRKIPIIAVTAYPDRFPRKEALLAGCDAYIVKPIDTRELPKQVTKTALRKKTRKQG